MSETLDRLFEDDRKVDLDAVVDRTPASPTVPSRSNLEVMAGQVAATAPDSAAAFEETLSQLEAGALQDHGTLNQLSSDFRADSEDALLGVLADPTLGDEEKLRAISGVRSTRPPSAREMLAEHTLVHSQEDGVGAEEKRQKLARDLEPILRSREDIEKSYNAELMRITPLWGAAMIDILQLMVPFQEQKAVGQILTTARAKLLEGDLEAYGSGVNEALGRMGRSKAELRKMWLQAPREQQEEIAKALREAILQHDEIMFGDTNHIFAMQMMDTVFGDANTEAAFEIVDDLVSVLDIMGLGSLLGQAAVGVADAVALAKRWFSPGQRPTSAAGTIEQFDAEAWRRLYRELPNMDDADSMALFGAPKADVEAGAVLPDPEMGNGVMFYKASTPHDDVIGDRTLLDEVSQRGNLEIDDRTNQMIALAKMKGLKMLRNFDTRAVQIEQHPSGSGLRFGVLLGNLDGTTIGPDLLIARAIHRLRRYGVTEDDLQLMVRNEDQWGSVPKTFKGEPGDEFAIRLNYDIPFRTSDIDKAPQTTPWDLRGGLISWTYALDHGGIYGNTTAGTGAAMRWPLDPQSMLDPRVTNASAVATDRVGRIQQQLHVLGSKFVDRFRGLGKGEQEVLNEAIIDANLNRKALTPEDLSSRGVTQDGIEAHTAWREYWDTQWHLENSDLKATLDSQGWGYYTQGTDLHVLSRPVSLASAKRAGRIYSPATGKEFEMVPKALEDLYEKGGTIVQLRQPVEIEDGLWVTHFLDRPELASSIMGGGWRPLNGSDAVLHYSRGYYTTQYTAKNFVIVRERVGPDQEISRAVGIAKTMEEAEQLASEYATQKGLRIIGEHDGLGSAKGSLAVSVRGDRTGSEIPSIFEADMWSLRATAGRTNQKVRGRGLRTMENDQVDLGHSYIKDPMQTLVDNARGTANRVGLRPTIEGLKLQAMKFWPEAFPVDPITKQIAWPTEANKIGGRLTASAANDVTKAKARAYWEYITSLETLHINAIDRHFKAILNKIGHAYEGRMLGRATAAAAESNISSPVGSMKHLSFLAMIGLNPSRQLPLQASQARLLQFVDPKYVFSQGLMWDLMKMQAARFDIPELSAWLAKNGDHADAQDTVAVLREFEQLGFPASIDRQILVRGTMLDLADRYEPPSVGRTLKTPLRAAKAVGFDAGEWINLASAYLVFRRQALKEGKKLTTREVEKIGAKARAFTLSMNNAGEMQMNKGVGVGEALISLLYQFMAVPHKATLAVMNRNLTGRERSAIVGGSLLLYGVPRQAVVAGLGQHLAEPGTHLRDLQEQGTVGVFWNTALSLAFGEEHTAIDFSSMAPADAYGMYEFIYNIATSGTLSALANAPGPSLFFGDNPRITNAIGAVARIFHPRDDFQSDQQYRDALIEIAKISSGFSNGFKARLSDLAERGMNANGTTTDAHANTVERMAIILGLPSTAATDRRLIKKKIYQETQDHKKDVKRFYDTLKTINANSGVFSDDPMFGARVFGLGIEVLGYNQVTMDELSRLFKNDVERNQSTEVFVALMRATGVLSTEDHIDLLRKEADENPDITEEMIRPTIDYMRKLVEEGNKVRETK